MKKLAFLFLFFSLALYAKTISIAITPVPYGDIMKFSAPMFKERGYELKVIEFTDYSIPNKILLDKQVDANLFQHKPYLDEFNRANKSNLTTLASIAIFPMAVYSQKIKDLKDVKEGFTVAIPNDPTNESRALELLESAKLIELDKKIKLKTPLNIVKNPFKLKFKELKAAQVPRALDDVDIAVINTDYALDFGLNPKKDSIYLEDPNSPYANFVVVRAEDINSEKSKVIKEILNSPQVKDFILKNYSDSTIPTF